MAQTLRAAPTPRDRVAARWCRRAIVPRAGAWGRRVRGPSARRVAGARAHRWGGRPAPVGTSSAIGGGAPTGLPATRLAPGTATTPINALPTGHLTPPAGEPAPTALPVRPAPGPTGPTSQTLAYGYDRLYRLTSASGGPTGATAYTYDPLGNRLTRTRNGAATTYAYDRADRITGATSPSGGTSYSMDAAGNLTARGSDVLAYDQANRLAQITSGGTTTTYAYDGDGKRFSKTVGSATTWDLYDVNRGLPVLLEDGARRYVWGLGLAYVVEGSSVLVYHVDGLGSVRAVTDGTKAVVQTYETDEFGVPISAGICSPGHDR